MFKPFPPLVEPIESDGDFARRLAELRKLERDGVPVDQTIEETLRAFEEYKERA